MSSHLLALAIGPVQDFIASARRTRDLWFGSYLLSEVSKAAANRLRDNEAELIFPAPEGSDELLPGSSLNVANKILAELPASLDPQDQISKAYQAAQDRWLEFAEEAHRAAGFAIREDIWNDQVEDVIEFYAAWTRLDSDYRASRERVERLLAGRKALRDFAPARGRAGVPKSSLDGARESVLSDPDRMGHKARAKARLAENEQLDAVGLTKRLAGEPDTQFVSVSRIAADTWVRRVLPVAKEKLAQIANLCHPDFANKISDETFQAFNREGAILYPSRLMALLKSQEMQEHKSRLEQIQTLLGQIISSSNGGGRLGEPSPYLAILVADGDRMGAAISAISSAETHRQFSRQLSLFAITAKEIIQANQGSLVYSGGDDVLAFLPIDTCLAAARQLHDKFGELMKDTTPGENLTLSVGIGIGHCLEPLEDLLNMGRKAEKAAKQGQGPDERDGLAIHLATRGAEPLTVRAQWTTSLDHRLHDWASLFWDNQLPDKVAYDFRQLAREYSGWSQERLGGLLQADALRVLKKKRSTKRELPQERIDLLLRPVVSSAGLSQIANELIIARHLAGAMQQVGESIKLAGEGNR